MSAKILKGGPVAAAMNEQTAQRVRLLREKGIRPCLAVVRLGERGDDIAYEKGITKRCGDVGVELRCLVLDEYASQRELCEALQELNHDSSVHGILVFMPLPEHIDPSAVRNAISPEKDVDGISPGSNAAVFSGEGSGFAACTARAVTELLNFYAIDVDGKKDDEGKKGVDGKNVCVFGRSLVIGRPVSMLLMRENATVTMCHSHTKKAPELASRSDIIVAAVGSAAALGKEYFSPGQTVVDVGINFDENGKMCGDVDFSAAENIVEAITPVPGGVGSVTTAVLMRQTVEAAEKLCVDNGSI